MYCIGWDLGHVWKAAENLLHDRIQSPDSPACSESLFLCRQYGILEEKRVRKAKESILHRVGSKCAIQIKPPHTHTPTLILALDGFGSSLPLPGHSTPEKKSGTHCTGWELGLVWTAAENLMQARIQSPDSPACGESLYQLRYRNPHNSWHARELTLCTKAELN